MGTLTLNVRRAGTADGGDIATIHDAAWWNAYSGMIPPRALTRMIQRRGKAWWQAAISRQTVILLLEIQGKTVGYATVGRNRVKTLPFDGEVYELYLLPEYQGIGAGSHLFLAAMGELKRRGLSGAVVWVLADNHSAIRFYENAGGKQVAEGKETFDDQDLRKIAFAWG